MRVPLSLVVFLALTACVSGNARVYYAEGVAVSTREGDLVQCNAEAFREFPAVTETRYTPQRFVEPQEVCDRNGECTILPGYYEGGDPYTVDINEQARQASAQACMIDAGYVQVELPRCGEDDSVRPTSVMARLTDTSCVIATRLGAEVVTPAAAP